jgi:hypothetical protein
VFPVSVKYDRTQKSPNLIFQSNFSGATPTPRKSFITGLKERVVSDSSNTKGDNKYNNINNCYDSNELFNRNIWANTHNN